MAPNDTTVTGRQLEPDQNISPTLIWKVRAVFAGTAGLVKTEAKPVRGSTPLLVGRGDSTGGIGKRLFLEDVRVSRDHAQLRLESSRAVLEDLGSKNGTEVNGRKLAAGEPCALNDGDVLRLGDSFLIVRHEVGSEADTPIPSLIGVSQAACKLRSSLARSAAGDGMVLLLGDTGTGKGAAAAAFHTLSRQPGKLVAVNCAAVPATLAESMFFGVRSGAYTGAVEHAGFFGEAHNGTLFLDEVGDLPSGLQPKLLHAIEAQQVTPLGSSRPVPASARMISATNRDLAVAMREGTFREDLFHRLAAIVIQLPPLRARREDVLFLAAHLAGDGFRPSSALVDAMLRHTWPGNVREVANIITRLRAVGEADVIAGLLSQRAGSKAAQRATSQSAPAWQSGDPSPTRAEMSELLERHQGNLSEIERTAGYSRRQFKRWIEQYGIELTTYRNPGRSG